MNQKIRKLKLDEIPKDATIVKIPDQHFEINLQTQALVEATQQQTAAIEQQTLKHGQYSNSIFWAIISFAAWMWVLRYFQNRSDSAKSSPTRHWIDD